ncbi:Flagellar motor switch protein FliN [hydrothermal vent metagenome]|uniref:Flagellar motor switch protein FliN n=1 Tax=hydrothermal vent metagenome TaxID=652676 RepID=A0A3B1DTW1_9ZZZZ
MADDNLLDPNEIDALLQSGDSDTKAPAETSTPPADDAGGGAMLDASEIDALLDAGGGGTETSTPPTDDAGGGAMLDASEIDALLQSSAPGAESPSTNTEGGAMLDTSEIDALLQSANSGATENPVAERAEALLNQAEADLAAAVAPSLNPSGSISTAAESATPFEFTDFGGPPNVAGGGAAIHALQDVELNLKIELGRTELLIKEVLRLKEGSVVPLDKLAGDPVDILVNGRLIARGEVLVLNDNFCVRVAEILTPEL